MERANPYLNNIAFSLLMVFSFVLMLSNAFAEILAIAILLIWIAQTLAYRRRNWLEFPLTIPLVAFIIFKIMVLAVNGYVGKINTVIEGMALPLIYFVVPGIVVTAERRRKIIWLIISGAVVAAAIGIFKYFMNISPKASSVISGSSTLAIYLTFSFILVIAIMACSVKLKEKLFLALVSVPLVVGVIFAFTRASYFAIFFASLLFGFLKDWKVLILLLIVAVGVFIFSSETIDKFNEKLDIEGLQEYYSNADSILISSLPILESPGFFGSGFNSFEKVKDIERQTNSHNESVGGRPNLYLQHLIDSGPVSLVFLFWILINQLRYSFAMFRRGKDDEQKVYQLAFVVIVFCFMIFGLAVDPLRDPVISMFFWLLMGLSLV